MKVMEVDHRDPNVAARLAELQRTAYRVEAALIGYEGIPGLSATAESVTARGGVRWLAAFDGDVIVGALCEERIGTEIEIDSLVVDPAHHRRGYATALVDGCLAQPDVTRWVVGTGEANVPALALYRSFGFTQFERDTSIVPYVRLEKWRETR
jgi:ribosomal protein S18 acetylase RimI-like enzyme